MEYWLLCVAIASGIALLFKMYGEPWVNYDIVEIDKCSLRKSSDFSQPGLTKQQGDSAILEQPDIE